MTTSPDLRARSRRAAEQIVDGCALAFGVLLLLALVRSCSVWPFAPRPSAYDGYGPQIVRAAFDQPAYAWLYQHRAQLARDRFPGDPDRQAAFMARLDSISPLAELR